MSARREFEVSITVTERITGTIAPVSMDWVVASVVDVDPRQAIEQASRAARASISARAQQTDRDETPEKTG